MAQKLEVNVEAKLKVSLDTVHACTTLLELWLNENPDNRELEYNKLLDGTYSLYPIMKKSENENGEVIDENKEDN